MTEPNSLHGKKYIRPETDDLLQDFHTDLSVGDIIRRARLRVGAEIPQIAQEIRIRESYLEAIEEGQLEKLPGRIYALGFIRTYAEHLGLDGEKIVQLLKRQSGEKVEHKPLGSTLPVDEDHSVPELKTIGILVVMIVAGLTLYTLYLTSDHRQREVPSVPADLKEQVTLLNKPQIASPQKEEESTTPESAAEQQRPTSDTEAAPPVHPIVLQAVDHVWLEIKNAEGKTIFSRVISAGEEYWVPEGKKGLVMTLGNAGGLQIVVDGEKLPILGAKGKVIRGLPLNVEYLKDILKKSSGRSM
ncbi:MAG TPA: DUF4115 domain-containing protein [Alphaproteobacteria bacterium]|nr:DUF4115 domain-containing protein [Alphaproteobacteria bacterium]